MRIVQPRFQWFIVLALIIALGELSNAQGLSIGLKAGSVLNDDIVESSWGESQSKRFLIGPVAEYRFTQGFALEGSFLYRRFGYASEQYGLPTYRYYWIRANSLEVPIVLKRYFSGTAQPFLSGGGVLRSLVGSIGHGQTLSYPDYALVKWEEKPHFESNPNVGVTFGGGIQLRSGRVRFSPEIRYTRWITAPVNESGTKGYELKSTDDQLSFLINLTFITSRKH
jgi:hypothetical protein